MSKERKQHKKDKKLLPGLHEAMRLLNLNYELHFGPGTILRRIKELES